MGTTISALRQGRLNTYLGRADSDTVPWGSSSLDVHLGDAIRGLWIRGIGTRVTGDATTASPSNEIAIPAGIDRVSRIDVIDSSGYYVDQVTNWRYKSSVAVIIQPLLASSITLRFHGWTAFLPDATDLPTELEQPVAMLAAALAYGELAGKLVNYKRQQGLDSPRVVGYEQAGALSAYWEARAERYLANSPYRTSYGQRSATR